MEKETQKKSLLRDILEVLIAVALITFVLVKFVLIPVQVDGSSMVPTLVDTDRGYSFILAKAFGIKRFDICVIDVGEGKLLVKRLIGLPGEALEFKEDHLYVNGEVLEEDFLGEDVHTEDFSITLGEDEYFFMGDNRSHSRDSRYYGPFHKEDIKASHVFILFPFDRMGFR